MMKPMSPRVTAIKVKANTIMNNALVPLTYGWGVSVELPLYLKRVDTLRQVRAAGLKFISAEPLLTDLGTELDLTGISQIIASGESGWHLRDVCQVQGAAYFLKQWGGILPDSAGYLLDGHDWSEQPRVMGDNGRWHDRRRRQSVHTRGASW